jgi:hypothetical protein
MDEKRITGSFVDLRLSILFGSLMIFFALCAVSAFFSFSFSTFLVFIILAAMLACAFIASVFLKTTVVMTLGKNERIEIYGPVMKREINGKIGYWAGIQPTGGFPNIIDLRLDLSNPGGKPIILLERIPVGAVPPILPVSNQRFLIPRDLVSDASHPGPLWKMVSQLLERDGKTT